MKFKIDENLPRDMKAVFSALGHDAVTVLDEEIGGGSDPNLASVCQKEGRVLVTLDLDFSDIRVYPPQEHPGIIVFRVRRQDKPHVLAMAQETARRIDEEPLTQRLWIVEEHGIRIRA